MDFLLYLLIGIPLITGVILRVLKFDEAHFAVTLKVSLFIFASVGVGYAFRNFKSPPKLIGTEFPIIVAASAGLIAFVFVTWIISKFEQNDKDTETLAVLLFFGAPVGAVVATRSLLESTANLEHGSLGVAAIIVATFLIVGAVNALLGPITAGFSISAFLHAMIFGEGFNHMFIWKDFFAFFEVSSIPLKIFIIAMTSIVSAYDTVAALLGIDS